jgi:hypothetical protein
MPLIAAWRKNCSTSPAAVLFFIPGASSLPEVTVCVIPASPVPAIPLDPEVAIAEVFVVPAVVPAVPVDVLAVPDEVFPVPFDVLAVPFDVFAVPPEVFEVPVDEVLPDAAMALAGEPPVGAIVEEVPPAAPVADASPVGLTDPPVEALSLDVLADLVLEHACRVQAAIASMMIFIEFFIILVLSWFNF